MPFAELYNVLESRAVDGEENAYSVILSSKSYEVQNVAGVGRMSMDTVTKGVMPFMIAQFLIMFLMVFFPWLVTGPAKLFHGGP